MPSTRLVFSILAFLVAADLVGCATQLAHEKQQTKRFVPYAKQNYALGTVKAKPGISALSPSQTYASNAPLSPTLNPSSPVPISQGSGNGLFAPASYWPSNYWPAFFHGNTPNGNPTVSGNSGAGLSFDQNRVRNAALPQSAGFAGSGDVVCSPSQSRSVSDPQTLNQMPAFDSKDCLPGDETLAAKLSARYGEETGSAFLTYLKAESKNSGLCPANVLAAFVESLCDTQKDDGTSCVLPRMGDVDLVAQGLLRMCTKEEDTSVSVKTFEELKKSPACLSNPIFKLDTWLRSHRNQ